MNNLKPQREKHLPSNPRNRMSDIDKRIFNGYVKNTCLKDLSSKERETLLEKIALWKFMLGINDNASGDSFLLLMSFIVSNFPNYNLTDMEASINLYSIGKIGSKLSHYGTLSPLFVGSLLQLYRPYRSRVINKMIDYSKKQKAALPLVVNSEESTSTLKELLKQGMEKFEKGEWISDYGDSLLIFIANNTDFFTSKIQKSAQEYAEKMKTKRAKEAKTIESQRARQEISNSSFKRAMEEFIKSKLPKQSYVNQYMICEWFRSFNKDEFKKYLESIREYKNGKIISN